jgi:anti-sigma regulatory factor (Ser/Thr protein kinase)
VITGQQFRVVMRAGGQVVDSAGHHVGRIVDVVLHPRTFQPGWVIVDCEPVAAVVVVPLARARLLGGCVQVPHTAADVCGAPSADGAARRLDPSRAEELSRYYDLLDGAGNLLDGRAPGPPRRPAHEGVTAATAAAPSRPGTPASIAARHRSRTAAPPGLTPVVPGLTVLAGRDAQVAYPGTFAGPWPPVSTSSPGPPWWRRRQWRWPSVSASVRTMRLELRSFLDVAGLPVDELDDLILAASEAGANAVEHAGSFDPFFDVLTEVGEDWAGVVIQDHGRWRARSPGGHRGRGLYMMGVLADVTLTVGSGGTTVVLRNRSRSAS